MDAEKFLRKFDKYLGIMVAHGFQSQKCLERTCVVELKRTFLPGDRRNINYWWNEELFGLRRTTLSLRRRVQRTVAATRDNAGQLVTEFKKARRGLRRAIERSKEEKWKEFCAILDQGP